MNDILLKAIGEHLGYDVGEISSIGKEVEGANAFTTHVTIDKFEYLIHPLTDGNLLIKKREVSPWISIGIVGAK